MATLYHVPTSRSLRVLWTLEEIGATVDGIAAVLGIGKVAARSLIGDVRHAKILVTQDKGVYRIAG